MMIKARRLLLPLALWLAARSLGVAAFAEQVAKPETGRFEHPLARLQFKNLGTVRCDMQFQEQVQPCYYVESPTAWSVPWGQHGGGASYPYLWLVDRGIAAARQPGPDVLFDDFESGRFDKWTAQGTAFAAGPRLLPPPLGMRSAVPLGGLGAGTVELRADGSFRDWNIFNNSPGGGGGKVQLDDALFGLWLKTADEPARAWTLRTHPPQGLPPIAEIEYAGAYPVSRLRFRKPNLPLELSLHAYSEFKMRDAEASATPAIVFSFQLTNPLAKAVDAAIFFNLPNHVRGKFSTANGLRLTRDGNEPVSGAMLLRFGGNQPVSQAAGNDLAAIWKTFAGSGRLGDQPLADAAGNHGAIAATLRLEPNETKIVNMVMAWRFPNRTHNGGRQRVGNHYAKLYPNVEDVADKVLARLPETWASILQWQRLCFDNSLPGWLQDAMINSVATMAKTGMWTEDGRWRQWESFSCSVVDPVHIHFYRSLPYVLLFPELQKSQLRGFASIQKPDGFINEDLGNSGRPMDDAQARGMGDCTSAFVLAVYMHYLWTNDRKLLDALWPHARKAARWQIERARRFGLPERLNNTYDWWRFEWKDVVAYNAVLHLAALQAASRLAKIEGDEEFAKQCSAEFVAARTKTDELLWTGEYYRAWWMREGAQTAAIHADTLYGQLWASMLGLGWLTDPEKVRTHLAAEMKYNASPFGLKVMQRRGRDAIDDLVWEAGSLDWAALNLYAGGAPAASLPEAGKVIDKWREHLCDPWDWRDLTRSDNGQPWCNSHYARQLIFWSIPLALSGQQYSAAEKRLVFAPATGAPPRLPWFTPQANGVLESLGQGKYRLTVLSGKLELKELRVAGSAPSKDVELATPGDCSIILNGCR